MKYLNILVVAMVLFACKKNDPTPDTPDMTTKLTIDSAFVSDFENVTVYCSYNRIDSGIRLIERGVYWGTSPDSPAIYAHVVTIGDSARFKIELKGVGKNQDIYLKGFMSYSRRGLSQADLFYESEVTKVHTGGLFKAWERGYTARTDINRVIRVLPTTDNGFVVLAEVVKDKTQYVSLSKIDTLGNLQWSTTDGDEFIAAPVDVIEMPSAYLVGTSKGVLKFDKSGSLIGEYQIPPAGSVYIIWDFVRLQAISNNTFKATVRTNQGYRPDPVNPTLRDLLFDMDGRFISETTMSNPGLFAAGPGSGTYRYAPAKDSSYAVCNHYYHYVPVNSSNMAYDAIVSSYDKNNNRKWEGVYGSEVYDLPSDVAVTSTGNVSVVGTTDLPRRDALWLFSLDKNTGSMLWENRYLTTRWGNNVYMYAYAIFLNKQDDHYIAGNVSNAGATSAYMAKFSASGRYSWEYAWSGPLQYTAAQSIYTSNNGDIFIFGIDGSTDRNLYVAKFKEY